MDRKENRKKEEVWEKTRGNGRKMDWGKSGREARFCVFCFLFCGRNDTRATNHKTGNRAYL